MFSEITWTGNRALEIYVENSRGFLLSWFPELFFSVCFLLKCKSLEGFDVSICLKKGKKNLIHERN